MKRKIKALIIWFVFISIPYLCWFLIQIVEWGLIPLFVEIIYFLPISWLGEPFFIYTSDIGSYIATSKGRIFGIIVYSIIYWSLYIVISKIVFKNRNKSASYSS